MPPATFALRFRRVSILIACLFMIVPCSSLPLPERCIGKGTRRFEDVSQVEQPIRAVVDLTIQEGWVAQPGGRGTFDILWSCFSTVFLCCWSALCLNVPPTHWGPWRRQYQKVLLACLGILGPEFIVQIAIGQWSSARRSMEDSRHSDYQGRTLRHAFFADMGGFQLQTPDWVPFPINAKQAHYLVMNDHIPFSAYRRG